MDKYKDMEFLIDQLLNDERVPSFPSDSLFSEQQWDALCEYDHEPMTQELFNSCLDTCVQADDGVMFYRIVEQFPAFVVNYDTAILNKYRKEYETYKADYIAKYGTDYFFG